MLHRPLTEVFSALALNCRAVSQFTSQNSEDLLLHSPSGSHSVMTRPRERHRPPIIHAPETTSRAILDTRSGETLRLDRLGPIVGA